MSTPAANPMTRTDPGRLATIFLRINSSLARFPVSVCQLVLRLALAVPFFRSGLTKWDGFGLADSVLYLFTQEFMLHVFGSTYRYPWPLAMGYASSIAEIMLPILLVLGLATRLSALGLLVMTLIIQLTIPSGWANFHLPWAAMALAIMTYGPGKLSMDHVIARARERSHP